MSSQKISHATDAVGEPLFAVASRAVGVRRAVRALTFMASWDYARRSMRRESLTLDEYRDWWRNSERTAYRDQALFREAFPGEQTPDRLLDLAEGQWVARQGIRGLGQVQLQP